MSACLTAGTASPEVTMTSTFSRTNSAANSANRSERPSAQRTSIAAVRPSVQPSSRKRCTRAATNWPWDDGVPPARTPMVGSLAGCCARAASGQRRRAAEQRDELAPPHSITSSARSRKDSGIASLRALAVVRSMTSSNLVGCSTGRSAGFAPLRILSTYSAERRNRCVLLAP